MSPGGVSPGSGGFSAGGFSTGGFSTGGVTTGGSPGPGGTSIGPGSGGLTITGGAPGVSGVPGAWGFSEVPGACAGGWTRGRGFAAGGAGTRPSFVRRSVWVTGATGVLRRVEAVRSPAAEPAGRPGV